MQFRCPVSASSLRVLVFSIVCLLFVASGPLLAGAAETQPPVQNMSFTHLTFNPPCGMVNQTITLTAKVIGIASGGTGSLPTGTVTFLQGSTQLGTATLGSNSTATFDTSFGTAGNYPITAMYSGDPNYMSSMDTETLQIGTTCLQTTTTSVSANPNPAQVGENVTLTAKVAGGTGLIGMITGTVDFLQDGTQIGTGTLDPSSNTATFSPPPYANTGMYSITATYEGNSQYLGSTSSPVILTIVPQGQLTSTTTTLSSSNPNSNFGDTVIFTASVQGGLGNPPTGMVTFLDGTTTLGTGTLANGATTYTTNGLSIGTHTITAQYGGDSQFSGSTSSPLTQNVSSGGNQTFILSVNPGIITVKQGQSGTATVTVSPGGGFNQPVMFVCSNLPLYAACSFDPSTVTPDGSNKPVTSMLTVTTGTKKAWLMRPLLHPYGSAPTKVLAVFSVGLLGLVQVKARSKAGRRRARLIAALLFVLCLVGTLWLVACGGSGSNANSVTPTGMTIVTVSGSTPTGAQSTSFTLNVE